MKLTVLGKYGKYPNKHGATCGYLIESNGGARVLLDMGSGVLRNLAAICDYHTIDGIILSHFHGDHVADAFVFRNIAFELTKTGVWQSPIPIFMPPTPENEFLALSSSGIAPQVTSDGMIARIKDLNLEFFEMCHTLPTFGTKISDGKKCVAYTADTRQCGNISKLIAGADLALVDACILKKDHHEQSPHISVYDIAGMTKDIPKTILTHLDCGKEADILSEALSVNKNCQLAQELKTILI